MYQLSGFDCGEEHEPIALCHNDASVLFGKHAEDNAFKVRGRTVSLGKRRPDFIPRRFGAIRGERSDRHRGMGDTGREGEQLSQERRLCRAKQKHGGAKRDMARRGAGGPPISIKCRGTSVVPHSITTD